MKITTVAEVPDELGQKWLQHLRDFDAAHSNCHFQISIDAPGMSVDQMVEMLQIDPPLSATAILRKQ